MTKTPTVSFANLICRFGDKFLLLDLANEIVLPAFKDASLRRKFAETRYFFLQVGIFEISPSGAEVPLLVVFGRFVKDTVLTREQIYSPERGLVPAEGSMPSAPSSFFALVLNNHKLMYVSETAHAPSLSAFQATLQKFLTIKYTDYVNALFEQLKISNEPKTKRQIRDEIPHPVVEVLPLASKASIEEFLRAFATVTHLEFKILATNQEFQMEKTFEALREMKKLLHARSTTLAHHDAGGLDKASAIEQIHAAAATGNEAVKLSGKSPEGVRLSGDNRNFKLTVPLEELPEKDIDKAVRLVKLYQEQVERESAEYSARTLEALKVCPFRVEDFCEVRVEWETP